jgi:hypothetical protein
MKPLTNFHLPDPPSHVLIIGAPSVGASYLAREVYGSAAGHGRLIFVTDSTSDAAELAGNFRRWKKINECHLPLIETIDDFRSLTTDAFLERIDKLFTFGYRRPTIIIRDVSCHPQPLSDGDHWLSCAQAIRSEYRANILTVCHSGPIGRQIPDASHFTQVWSIAEGWNYSDGVLRERVNHEVTVRTPFGAIHLRSHSKDGFQLFDAIEPGLERRLAS